jgi:hypothetical protein
MGKVTGARFDSASRGVIVLLQFRSNIKASSLFEDRVLGATRGVGGQVSLIDQHAPRGAGRWTLGATSVTSLSLLMLQSAHLSMPRTLAYREFDFYYAKAQGFIIINESASDEQQASENKKGFSDAPILRCFFRDP